MRKIYCDICGVELALDDDSYVGDICDRCLLKIVNEGSAK